MLVNWLPLVGIEELGLAVARDRLLDLFDAKIGVHGVRQAPGQHAPAEPVHHREQVDEAALAIKRRRKHVVRQGHAAPSVMDLPRRALSRSAG